MTENSRAEQNTEKNDLISVVVPVYQVEQYLKRCVDSILAQTYENLEILLVDDGSTDSSPAICDAYEKKDARVRVIHQENQGLSGARNTGIAAAKGAYISLVDSDDFLAPDFIQVLYHMCVEQQAELSQCRYTVVHGDTLPKETGVGQVQRFTGREMMMQMYTGGEAYFTVAWNKLYRRDLFTDIRYPMGRIHEDEATTYRIYDRVQKAAVTTAPLYGYYVRAGSITKSFRTSRLDWLTALQERLSFYEEKGYEELLFPTWKHYADGVIHLYLQYRSAECFEEKRGQEMKREVRRAVKAMKGLGRLPLVTRIGYGLFAVSPGLYERFLKRMQGGAA